MIEPSLLLNAYCAGYFPMAESRTGDVRWYSPDPRGILDLDRFTVSRRLARTVRQGKVDVRFDSAFEQVIRACSSRDETWLSEELIASYVRLHDLGFAHSTESWREGELVGGLYGVAIGGAFFGESMFSRQTDASKIALVALVERLRERGFMLLDTQFITEHLARFGATEIPRDEYLRRLQTALAIDTRFA